MARARTLCVYVAGIRSTDRSGSCRRRRDNARWVGRLTRHASTACNHRRTKLVAVKPTLQVPGTRERRRNRRRIALIEPDRRPRLGSWARAAAPARRRRRVPRLRGPSVLAARHGAVLPLRAHRTRRTGRLGVPHLVGPRRGAGSATAVAEFIELPDDASARSIPACTSTTTTTPSDPRSKR